MGPEQICVIECTPFHNGISCRTMAGSCSFFIDPLNSNEDSKCNQVHWINLSSTPAVSNQKMQCWGFDNGDY